MKRVIMMISAVAAIAFVAACEKNPTPDAKCGIESISFEKSSNSALSKDISGKIDGESISFVIPSDIVGSEFTASFSVSEFDVVKFDGVEAKSGVSKLKNGSKIDVIDEVSAMSAKYTVAFIGDDEAAELVSLVIKASENEGIVEDVAPDAIASEMLVRVPGAAFQKELKITVEAGLNDEIKVNGEKVESGASIAADTKFPVDIEVSDPVSGIKNSYVLKVGKILNVIVEKVVEGYEGDNENIGASYMAVNPIDGKPYVAYIATHGDDANKGVYVAKWDGAAYSLICNSSASDCATSAASSPVIAFNADGEAFVKYIGGEVKNFNSVKKFNGSEWVLVGEAGKGITTDKINTSYQIPLFFLPGSSNPMTTFTGNQKSTTYYRSIGLTSFNGSSWVESVPAGLPRYGDRGGSDGMYYSNATASTADKTYSVFALNQYGFFVTAYSANGSNEIIVSDLVPEGETCGLPGNLGIACAPDGTPYIFEALWKAGAMQVYKVDEANKTATAYGSPLKVVISESMGTVDDPAAFGINPVTGQMVVAVEETAEDGSKTLKFKYMDEGGNWVDFNYSYPVGNDKAFIKEIGLGFSSDGICYVHTRIGNNKEGDGVVGIHLFKIGLEEDIIPE